MTTIAAINSDWRKIGDTTLEMWKAELSAVSSPMLAQAESIFTAARPHSALILAQSFLENKHNTTNILIPRSAHNFLSIRPPAVGRPGPFASGVITAPDGGQFEVYRSFADCAREWKRRCVEDRSYKGGVYAKTTTLNEFLGVYAPAGDVHPVTGKDNADIGYYNTVVTKLNQFARQEGPVGEPHVPTPQPAAFAVIPVNKKMMPRTNRNWPGQTLNASGGLYILVHETGNTRAGADAAMHANFVYNGGGASSVSFHFTVDRFGAYQMMPCNVVGWHASDGCNNRNTDWGCFASVAIETCVDSNNAFKAATRKNLATLIAMIITGHPSIDFGGIDHRRFSADRIRTHHQSADDGKWCPTFMLNEGYIPVLVNDVRGRVAGGTSGLAKGDTVRFTDNLNVRRAWSLAETFEGKPNVLATFPAGTTATIIGGPNVNDGHTWWDLAIPGFGTGHASGLYLEEIAPARPEPVFKSPAVLTELAGKEAANTGAAWTIINGIKFRGVWDTVEAIRDTPQLLYASQVPGEVEYCGPTIKKGDRRYVTHMVEGTGTKAGETAEYYYDEHGARLIVTDFKRVAD